MTELVTHFPCEAWKTATRKESLALYDPVYARHPAFVDRSDRNPRQTLEATISSLEAARADEHEQQLARLEERMGVRAGPAQPWSRGSWASSHASEPLALFNSRRPNTLAQTSLTLTMPPFRPASSSRPSVEASSRRSNASMRKGGLASRHSRSTGSISQMSLGLTEPVQHLRVSLYHGRRRRASFDT
mmetsp:Transcript_42074/g.116214  ORF Transcript_42074/g.116214 Transcript_42074/m.116214 type:complete len:188 (+) Transcript_42074:88-651(+)